MRSAAVLILLIAFASGCKAPAPRPKGASGARAASAVTRTAEALDASPLDPVRIRDLAAALASAHRMGEAHAAYLTALFVLDHPPHPSPTRSPAGRGSPGGTGAALARDEVERAAEAARDDGRNLVAGAGGGPASARAREEAAALYEGGRYAEALARIEHLARARRELPDPRMSRLGAACHLRLGEALALRRDPAGAVRELWAAANAHALARDASLYRDIGRLERAVAAECDELGQGAAARAALRRSFRASPGDPETLFSIAARRDLGAAEQAYGERLLRSLYPGRPEVAFLDAASTIHTEKDGAAASAAVDRFAREHANEPALVLSLRAILAERSKAQAERDAAAARARLAEARRRAEVSRAGFETGPAGPSGTAR